MKLLLHVTYEIRNYSEEYLEKQVEIGSSIVNTWLGGQQSSLQSLQKAYSKDSFDPHTKLYAFKNGQMIGFLTSGISSKDEGRIIIANMEFPIMYDGHKEAEEMIINAAFNYFRSQSVSVVFSRASTLWGKTMRYVGKFDYELSRVLWKGGSVQVSDFTNYIDSVDVEVVDTDVVTDITQIQKILMEYRNMSESAAFKQIDLLKSIPDRVISWNLIRKEGKIVGYSHLVKNKFDAKNAQMYTIYATGKNTANLRDQIMSRHIDDCREKGIETIYNFLRPPQLDNDREYEKYGFMTSPVAYYIKTL